MFFGLLKTNGEYILNVDSKNIISIYNNPGDGETPTYQIEFDNGDIFIVDEIEYNKIVFVLKVQKEWNKNHDINK